MASHSQKKRRPASTVEGLEQQLISDSMELAARQIREGSVSAQVLTHFLKLGSVRGRLEEEKIKNENLLLAAKIESMNSYTAIKEMYAAALAAMRAYSGAPDEEFMDDDPEL